jgi:hypothetical protein
MVRDAQAARDAEAAADAAEVAEAARAAGIELEGEHAVPGGAAGGSGSGGDGGPAMGLYDYVVDVDVLSRCA